MGNFTMHSVVCGIGKATVCFESCPHCSCNPCLTVCKGEAFFSGSLTNMTSQCRPARWPSPESSKTTRQQTSLHLGSSRLEDDVQNWLRLVPTLALPLITNRNVAPQLRRWNLVPLLPNSPSPLPFSQDCFSSPCNTSYDDRKCGARTCDRAEVCFSVSTVTSWLYHGNRHHECRP